MSDATPGGHQERRQPALLCWRFFPAARRLTVWLFVCVLAWCSAGCRDKGTPELGTVKGKVVQKGRSLPDAWIEFQPAVGRTSIAVTSADGTYELYYGGSEMGAKIGMHTVRVGSGGTAVPNSPDTATPRVLLFEQEAVEIKPGENVYDFDVPEAGTVKRPSQRPKTST